MELRLFLNVAHHCPSFNIVPFAVGILDHGLDIAESRVPYLKVREICNNPDDKDDVNDDDDDIATRASAARSFSN